MHSGLRSQIAEVESSYIKAHSVHLWFLKTLHNFHTPPIMQIKHLNSLPSLETWRFLNAKKLGSYSPLLRRWRICIFNLSRLQWNSIWQQGSKFCFSQIRGKHLICISECCRGGIVLHLLLLLQMSFLFWKVLLICDSEPLMVCDANFLLSKCATFFCPWSYILPLNRAQVDALVLWISLQPLAVLGIWGPLKAVPISLSMRIRIRANWVRLHLSAFFSQPNSSKTGNSEGASLSFNFQSFLSLLSTLGCAKKRYAN